MSAALHTYADYREHRVDFATFYGGLARECGVTLGSTLQAEANAALAKGDTFLSTIPIRRWDNLASAYELKMLRAIRRSGSCNSPATRVCILKGLAQLTYKETFA